MFRFLQKYFLDRVLDPFFIPKIVLLIDKFRVNLIETNKKHSYGK